MSSREPATDGPDGKVKTPLAQSLCLSPVSRLDPERWVEQYGDDLFGFAAARVRDGTMAHDLVQETFLADACHRALRRTTT